MKSSWEKKAGHLTCQWSELGQRSRYNEPWMKTSHIQRSLTQCGAGMPLHLARVHAKFFHVVIDLD